MFVKNTAWLVLVGCLIISVWGCTSTKYIKLDSPPKSIRSKNIEVVAKDGTSYSFKGAKSVNDTLYGVDRLPFPADLHSQEVTALPYSSIASAKYVAYDYLGTAAIAASLAAVATLIYVEVEF